MSYWYGGENWESNYGGWNEWNDSSYEKAANSDGRMWRFNDQNDWHYESHSSTKGPRTQASRSNNHSQVQHEHAPKGGKGILGAPALPPDVVAHAYMKGKARGLSMLDDPQTKAGKGAKPSIFVDLPIMPAVSNETVGKGAMAVAKSTVRNLSASAPLSNSTLSLTATPESQWNAKIEPQGEYDAPSKKKHNKMKAWRADEKEEADFDDKTATRDLRENSRQISSDSQYNTGGPMFTEYVNTPAPKPARTSELPPQETQLPEITPLLNESLRCVIESLYRDRIRPTTKVLKERLMSRYPKPTSEQHRLVEHFPSVCITESDIYRVEYRANDSIFYLKHEPSWFEGWIELEGIVEDEYGDVFWMAFSDYIDNLRKALPHMEEARLGDRNEELLLAMELRQQALPFLQNKSLGEMCAVVRLARSKGLLAFRRDNEYLHEV
eukprot:GEMP01005494.1.p1 GENE.GEMP01005494.1~~GEMP01005494.1.p1  ORF type:complete len:438 (+),score=54.39 GEMP01005494.1:24-1337(+)